MAKYIDTPPPTELDGLSQSGRTPVCNLDEALDRLGNDTELLHEVIDLFFQDCPSLLQSIHDAIGSHNSAALHRSAHKLKGAIGYLGCRKASELAYRLETIGQSLQLEQANRYFQELSSLLDEVRLELSDWVAQPV